MSNNKCDATKSKKKNSIELRTSRNVQSVVPRERQKLLKWNGWGYNDSKFVIHNEDLTVSFIGDR